MSPPEHTKVVMLTTRRARSAAEPLKPHTHHPGATFAGGGGVATCVAVDQWAVGRFRPTRVCKQMFTASV